MMKTLLVFMLFFSLTACTGLQQGVGKNSNREVNNHRPDVRKIAQGKNVRVFNTSYLGAKIVYKVTNNYPPEFKKTVDVRTTGTLTDLVEQVRSIAKVNFRVEQEEQSADEATQQEVETLGVTAMPGMPGAVGGSTGGKVTAGAGYDYGNETCHSVHYSGDIEGYFHMLSNKFGAEWAYNNEKRIVEFKLKVTKTFSVYAMPGDTSYKTTISNTADSSNSPSAASMESAQTNETKYVGNFWTTLSASVTTMLTANGRSNCNPNIGTVTVTDTPKVVRNVEQYIAQLNTTLGRQVAYEVRVLALQTNNSGDVGFDLSAVLESNSLSLATASVDAYKTFNGVGSVTAQLLTGQGSGSAAVIKALKSWGEVSQITSASGFALHNTPTPVQVGGETAYVSSAATTLDGQGNSTSTITTSKVPEGFYMTVIPNILKDNKVLLQYNISLSNIETIETFSASDDTKVQLPEVSNRSFSQKVRMQMGQTLVLGGFEQTVLSDSNGYGILGGGSSNEKTKRTIVIIISIDSAGE